MKIIASGRKTNRTSQLIDLCAEAEARGEVSYIVTTNHAEASRVAQVAREKDLKIGFPLTFDEFLNREYAGGNISNLYIDNLDQLLYRLTPVHIEAIVLLKEDE